MKFCKSCGDRITWTYIGGPYYEWCHYVGGIRCADGVNFAQPREWTR